MGRKSIDKKRSKNTKKKDNIIKKVIPIYSKYGLKDLTMNELAKELGITKATLYNYFSTREEIVEGTLRYILDNIKVFEHVIRDEKIDYIERYYKSVQILCENVKDVSNIFLRDLKTVFPHLWFMVDTFRDYATNILEDFYKNGQAKGIFKDFNINIYVLTDRLFLDALANAELLESNNLTLEKAFLEYFKMKCFGIVEGEYKSQLQNIIEKH